MTLVYNSMKFLRPILAVFILIIIALGVLSCESKYDRLVGREMATGIKKDSLVFGLYFGDTRKEFFGKCWNLNKQGLVIQGPNNEFVQHILEPSNMDSIKSPIQMLFYGIFDESNIMRGLNMRFSYPGSSIWNKNLTVEKLGYSIKDTLYNWYPGNKFLKLSIKGIDDVYVKVDGNRQILIYPKNDEELVVKIEDLDYKYTGIEKLK